MNMLTFMAEENNDMPIYSQLYEFIKSEILSGNLYSGSKLPSKRKLSSNLGISQNTVQAAYGQLIEEGYLVSYERKGYFVAEIENVFNLKNLKKGIHFEQEIEKESNIYNFSYHGVDRENFPFSIWRKLTRDVINEYDKGLLELGGSQGDLDLRKSISNYLRQSRGVDCTAKQIIISSGTEFLFQILIQLFDRECIYGIENPGYEKLNLLFQSNRARYIPIDVDEKGIKVEEARKKNVSILCVTPSHQFPTGNIMPIKRRINLLNWANESDERYIIEDDYDSEFKYSGKPIPALQGIDKRDKVVYMGTFSKSLSPSFRVSYMVLPENLLEEYKNRLKFIICPVPIIEQKVLQKFISEGYFERHLNKMKNIYKKKRELLVEEVEKIKADPQNDLNLEISGADAGLHLLLNISNGLTEEELVERAFRKGVKVYGISKYYFGKNENSIDNKAQILLGYAALNKQEIINGVKLLIESWKD